MFKTAATKIAHNSTIPALAGNKDLRPLQDVITAEKTVLISLQKLSVDFGKAAEALRLWGAGEGEDLLDTLAASTNLLNLFSSAISNYASHEHAIRDHMKSIRSREETLDELKRRRKALISKADAAERKLSKMSPEHKNLGSQTDTLNRLRDDIRVMDSEIMSDEASLGDFKRSKTKTLMGLKFGGLLECCEKGTIVGEFGRLVIAEIPQEPTQPGMPRAMYVNHQKVNSLLGDATRCVDEVTFSTVGDPSASPPNYLAPPQGMGTGHFLNSSDIGSSVPVSPITTNPNWQSEQSRSTDDFAMGSPIGNRFGTYPQSGATGYSLPDRPSSLNPMISEDDSFSSSVATALNARKSIEGPAPSYDTYQDHLPGPPSGAAAPLVMPSPWEPLSLSDPNSNSNDQRISTYDDDVGLAYMTNTEEVKSNVGDGPGHARQEVHFGQVHDIDMEMEKRYDQEALQVESVSEPRSSPKRIPPPTFSTEDEERAMNAAVARELSREMDSLKFSPVSPVISSIPSPRVEISQASSRERESSFGSGVTENERRSVSPPIASVSSFTQPSGSHSPIQTDLHNDDIDKPTSPVSTHNLSPRMSLPERTTSNESSYRTPPEYPRLAGASPFGQRSTASLVGNAPSSPVVGGAPRTISAAAFRRPVAVPGRSTSNDIGSGPGIRSSSPLVDVSPLQPKKRGLPNAPHMSNLVQSNTWSPDPHPGNFDPGNRVSQAGSDDHYDYISAYTDAPPGSGSPQKSDYGSLGQIRVANDQGGSSPVEGQFPAQPGYRDGRYTTNLEGELR
ncbi:hypothetical protein BDP27DRAFT_1414539 [Rhodocollybia butyracea]|uniref:Eisosome component PIL1-domain-containing protein n=1 Tax=Rhodocollybia butyracea TaxID=206335 RepID=A0A9P5Q8A7_9AGAR|nr:hypothetical protein BDP27DRAFT_1414539 [Rhodocollybia butyracea]